MAPPSECPVIIISFPFPEWADGCKLNGNARFPPSTRQGSSFGNEIACASLDENVSGSRGAQSCSISSRRSFSIFFQSVLNPEWTHGTRNKSSKKFFVPTSMFERENCMSYLMFFLLDVPRKAIIIVWSSSQITAWTSSKRNAFHKRNPYCSVSISRRFAVPSPSRSGIRSSVAAGDCAGTGFSLTSDSVVAVSFEPSDDPVSGILKYTSQLMLKHSIAFSRQKNPRCVSRVSRFNVRMFVNRYASFRIRPSTNCTGRGTFSSGFSMFAIV
uniref:Uncharacterized protein n=1 Tax=Paramoeba aestuarina TaxID=180227 RepID=A0A7S4JJ90_9EUKA|mmetsp:Transcript_10940/g.16539  ORF Transcript_10940/g.16539 Transcript_10940/m.16539 type:complete len:271 (+) Transcript_10940:392-1204(+)